MSDGGYNALMKAARRAKPGAPRLLSCDEIPEDWMGVAFGIQYRAGNGQTTRRWITVRSVDLSDGSMWAYCWARRDLRTFRLDRIREVVDGDGQVLSGEEFALALGSPRVSMGDPERSPGRYASILDTQKTGRLSKRERKRAETGRRAVRDVIAAQRAAREEKAVAPLPIHIQIAVGLGLAAVVLGLVWLFG